MVEFDLTVIKLNLNWQFRFRPVVTSAPSYSMPIKAAPFLLNNSTSEIKQGILSEPRSNAIISIRIHMDTLIGNPDVYIPCIRKTSVQLNFAWLEFPLKLN